MKNYERYPVGVDRSGISPPDDGWLVTSRNPKPLPGLWVVVNRYAHSYGIAFLIKGGVTMKRLHDY